MLDAYQISITSYILHLFVKSMQYHSASMEDQDTLAIGTSPISSQRRQLEVKIKALKDIKYQKRLMVPASEYEAQLQALTVLMRDRELFDQKLQASMEENRLLSEKMRIMDSNLGLRVRNAELVNQQILQFAQQQQYLIGKSSSNVVEGWNAVAERFTLNADQLEHFKKLCLSQQLDAEQNVCKIAELNDSIQHLQFQLTEKQSKIESQKIDKKELRQTIADLREQLTVTQKSESELREKLLHTSSDQEIIQQQYENAKAELENERISHQNTSTQLQDLQQKVVRYDGVFKADEKTAKELRLANEQILIHKNKIKALEQAAKEVQKEIQNQKIESEKGKQQLLKTLDSERIMRSQLETAKKELEKLRLVKQLGDLLTVQETCEQKIQQSEKIADSFKTEVELLKNELEMTKHERVESTTASGQKISALQKQLESVTNELNLVKTKLTEHESVLRKSQMSEKDLQRQLEEQVQLATILLERQRQQQ